MLFGGGCGGEVFRLADRRRRSVASSGSWGWAVNSGLESRRGAELQWAGASSVRHVRNLGGVAAEASPRNAASRCVLFGDFELDRQEQTLRRGGDAVKIPGKIYQAMVVLIESPGDLVTREQLRNRLWPREANLNYDANVNTTVNKLRQVLGDSSEGSNFIQTVPRRGYSFVAAVRYADAPAVRASEAASGATVASLRGFAGLGEALRSERARIWFTASVVTWVMVAILFAVAMLWHTHKAAAAVKSSARVIDKSIDKQAVDKR
jgi:DNA-binding winged helix-turn-helix (wHTH) protein